MNEEELQDFPLLVHTDQALGTGVLTLVLSPGSLSACEVFPKASCACVLIPIRTTLKRFCLYLMRANWKVSDCWEFSDIGSI